MHHSSLRRAALCAAIVLAGASATAQDSGGGHGDVLGDLVHIKRSPETGQPILQKRWIEYPGDVLDWGYCPIPVDAAGAEIPFADLSCDVDPAQLTRLVEVDYFGRLSGGRTKERNLRMHFDEFISTIMDSEAVDLEATGRIKLGTGCTADGACASWKVIDSPMENMGVYYRLLKYGHLQTDPAEVDESFHGDPALGTVYHPALRAEDWAKFRGSVASLLPRASASECFSGTTFVAACAAPQSLTAEDFVRAASFLAGAADKTGKITADLVQYLNRILKITVATEDSAASVDTLPALIRDESGAIAPAPAGLPAPADELFVDFTTAAYFRDVRYTGSVPALVTGGAGLWQENPAVPLLPFLVHVYGPAAPAVNLDAFLKNSNDALRAVEFVHNYAIPEDLYVVYATPTTTAVASVIAQASTTDQTLTLSATVVNATPVNGGTVTFTVQTSGGTVVGLPAVSGTVTNGAASASYVLPGGTGAQILQIIGAYSGAPGFAASSGTGTLSIAPLEPPQISISNASVAEGTGTSSELAFELRLSGASTVPVTVQYTTGNFTAVAPIDYGATSGTVTFDPGTTSTVVRVAVNGDSDKESDETMMMALSSPSYAVIARAMATGQILDDDGGTAPLLDFNRDGMADLVWRNVVDGRIAIWYMLGTTQLTGTATQPPEFTDLDWEIRAVGDFNGDWKPDLVWQNRVSGALAAWFLDGNVVTGGAELYTLSGGTAEPVLAWKIVGAADMDGDGQLDLVWQHQTTGEARIWHMCGRTQIDSVTVDLGADTAGWQIVGVADMNGDGRNDLVWRSQTTGGLAAWLMDDEQLLAAEWLSPDSVVDPAWNVAGVRDMNLDGQADLVWQHSGTGALAVWFMNGLVQSSGTSLTPDTVSDLDWKIVGIR